MNTYVYLFPCIWGKNSRTTTTDFEKNTVYLQLTTTGMCYLTIKTDVPRAAAELLASSIREIKSLLGNSVFINISPPPRHLSN